VITGPTMKDIGPMVQALDVNMATGKLQLCKNCHLSKVLSLRIFCFALRFVAFGVVNSHCVRANISNVLSTRIRDLLVSMGIYRAIQNRRLSGQITIALHLRNTSPPPWSCTSHNPY
jgi:hypothetical protein